MCSLIVLGGGGGGLKNQSVSGVTTACLMQCNTSPSHRVDQVVDWQKQKCCVYNFVQCILNELPQF